MHMHMHIYIHIYIYISAYIHLSSLSQFGICPPDLAHRSRSPTSGPFTAMAPGTQTGSACLYLKHPIPLEDIMTELVESKWYIKHVWRPKRGARYSMQVAYVYWRCRQNLMRSFEVGITDVEGDSKKSRRMDCRHIYVEAKSPANPLPDLHHECLDILQCVHHNILTDSLVIDTPTPAPRLTAGPRAC